MSNRQVDKKNTFQARVDKGWWKVLMQLKTETGKGIKELIEDALINTYYIGKDGKPQIYKSSIDEQAKDILGLARN